LAGRTGQWEKVEVPARATALRRPAACAAGGILLGKFMLLYFVFLPKAAAAAGVPVELVKEILAANGGYATIFKDMFSPMDLLFIGLAIVSAFKLGSGASSGD
jgi:hypothetical protein